MHLVRFVHPTSHLSMAGKMIGASIQAGDETFSLEEIRLLAPCIPTKIICVGRNTPITPKSWVTRSLNVRSSSSSRRLL